MSQDFIAMSFVFLVCFLLAAIGLALIWLGTRR